MCRKECVKDYLPSVDVQATEGLMGKILLCMYARKAYVSCAFMCLSTSNTCWIIYNNFHALGYWTVNTRCRPAGLLSVHPMCGPPSILGHHVCSWFILSESAGLPILGCHCIQGLPTTVGHYNIGPSYLTVNIMSWPPQFYNWCPLQGSSNIMGHHTYG